MPVVLDPLSDAGVVKNVAALIAIVAFVVAMALVAGGVSDLVAAWRAGAGQ
ncbi:MAG: hypothetical protein WDM94_09425 [Bauldia sp.]